MRTFLLSKALLWLTFAGIAVIVAPGCYDINVSHVCAPDPLDAWKDSAVLGDELSPRTRQTLRRLDLEAVYRRDPDEAALRLHAAALREPQPDLLFALAEISYHRGRQVEKRSCCDALPYYYLSAGYAYHFIFDHLDSQNGPSGGGAMEIFDPRFRLACDLYNAGLSKCLRAAQKTGRFDARDQLRLPTSDPAGFTLSVVHHGFAWQPEEFGALEFADDFRVTGLANQYRTYGLGVPLIGNRGHTPSSAESGAGDGRDYLPKEARFPVTAFFRFEGTLADLSAKRTGQLELYNPLNIQTILVRGHAVPLETDLTTPLAYYLAKSGLDGLQYKLFIRPDEAGAHLGIRMLEPYQPGKIPVLLVHGLLSSPLTWAPALNDLTAEPAVRKHFQFWTYFYPSSQPYLVTASELRRSLARLRQEVDPEHRDAAFDEMVLVSHSMGGLVSKLLTVDSGDDFRMLISDRPLDQLKLQPATRSELEQVVYFQHEPQIHRVVFIATPHRGSQLSPSVIGRLGDELAGMPRQAARTLHDLTLENPELRKLDATPTSIDELAPDSPVLAALAAKKPVSDVHYHSIIGVTAESSNPVAEWLTGIDAHIPGDGVVPYRSAHLDEAESEVIVPAEHMHVHHHPLAILELRRILLEHYQDVERRRGN
jgi:pimeloyl-ACP methyl ester carboxylesterase